jgi:hypothetical protein
MIGFCVDPPEDSASADVIVADRGGKPVVPDSVSRFINGLAKFPNAAIEDATEIKNSKNDFETKKQLKIEDFLFVEADLKNRVLRKDGKICDRFRQLFISLSTIKKLYDERYDVSKRITSNMLHTPAILYVLHTNSVSDRAILKEVTNSENHLLTLDLLMETNIRKITYFFEGETHLTVFALVTYPPFTDVKTCAILSPETKFVADGRSIVCKRDGKNFHNNINVDIPMIKEKYNASLISNEIEVVSSRQADSPVTEEHQIMYYFYDDRFSKGSFQLIIFGDSYPYHTETRDWNEELAVVNHLASLCTYDGAVVMTTTLYTHEDSDPLQRLTTLVNETASFSHPMKGHTVCNRCEATLVDYSPIIGKRKSVLIQFNKTRLYYSPEITSSPAPISVIAGKHVKSTWKYEFFPVKRYNSTSSVPALPSIDVFVKHDNNNITIIEAIMSDNEISITYRVGFASGTHDIVFEFRDGKILWVANLTQQIQVLAATPAAVNDGDDGGSRLFRSGKLLDMMLQ